MNKEQTLAYIRDNDFDVQNANAAFSIMDLVFISYVDSDQATGVVFGPVLTALIHRRQNIFSFYQILHLQNIETINRNIYHDYLSDPKTLSNKINDHVSWEKKIDEAWQNYKSSGDIHIFKEFIAASKKWWQYGIIGEDKAEVVNKEVAPRFAQRKNIEVTEAMKMMNVLAHPEKQSPMSAERKAFLQICLDLIDQKDIATEITNYVGEYFWMESDFFTNREINSETVLGKAGLEIKKRSREDIMSEIESIDGTFQKIHEESEKIRSSLELTAEDEADIAFAKLMIEWMDSRKVGMMKGVYYLFAFLEDIARLHGLDYETVSTYSIDETLALVERGEKVPAEEIEKRYADSFLIFDKNGLHRFYGQDAHDLLAAVHDKHSQVEEIKGAVASTGNQEKIRGKVRIVLDPLKDEFYEGDILVTSMTRVEFVPLMRQAKAIITNEGGIACHAAIISRELGVPCIIGTRNATKILKNGDEVELDLKTGHVTI
jgi:phosphohistidine swiveling domain-containing protein